MKSKAKMTSAGPKWPIANIPQERFWWPKMAYLYHGLKTRNAALREQYK